MIRLIMLQPPPRQVPGATSEWSELAVLESVDAILPWLIEHKYVVDEADLLSKEWPVFGYIRIS